MAEARTNARVSFRTILSFWGGRLGTFGQLGSIWAAFWLLSAALHAATYLAMRLIASHGTFGILITGQVLASVSFSALGFIVWAIMDAFGLAIVDALHQLPLHISSKVEYKPALHKSWSFAKLGLLIMLRLALPTFLFGFAIGAILFGDAHIRDIFGLEHSRRNLIAITCVHVTIIATMLVWVVKLLLDYCLAPCFVMDGQGAFASLKLSKGAVKGFRLKIMWLHVLTFVLLVLPVILAGAMFPVFWLLLLFVAPLHHVIGPFVYRSVVPASVDEAHIGGIGKSLDESAPLLKSPV